MNKDEQIEEMADIIFKTSPIPSVWRSDAVRFAENLYNAGYRKASDVAREIFEEIERMCIDTFGNFNHRVFAELKKKYTEDGK